MRATWNGTVLADSDRTIEVDGYVYFPRESVKMDLLRIAPKTAADQRCPHGVQFYDVKDAQQSSERGAWSYEATTHAAMKPIEHWLGLVRAHGIDQHMETVAWLKSEHGMGHGHANAIVAHVKAHPA